MRHGCGPFLPSSLLGGAIVELTVSSRFVQGGYFIFTVRTEDQYGTSSFSEPVRVIVADSEDAQLPGIVTL